MIRSRRSTGNAVLAARRRTRPGCRSPRPRRVRTTESRARAHAALDVSEEPSIEGVRRVLALRSEYGQPRKPLGDPMKYLDLTYYERALTP